MARRFDPDRFHRESSALVRWIEARRVAEVVEALALRRGQRVLEVGCGAGNVLEPVASHATAFGIDLSNWLCHKAMRRVGPVIAMGRGESLPFRDASFDRVFATEVVEHVPGPVQIVEELIRVVRPGGRVVVTTPHERLAEVAKRVSRILGISRSLLRETVQPDGNAWHLHRFDRSKLLAIFGDRAPSVRVHALPSRLLPFHHLAVLEKAGDSPPARGVPRPPLAQPSRNSSGTAQSAR